MAHGWRCLGIDIKPQPAYPGEFIQADIAHMYELPEADFYCCSSPCERFSVHAMKHFHPNPAWPWLGIALFEHAQQMLSATGKPYVMENVRAAERFIGRAVNHCGPFYLWGSAVPAIMPVDAYRVTKGIDMGSGSEARRVKVSREKAREYNSRHPWSQRKKVYAAANAAEIPFEISAYIGQVALGMA